VQHDRQLIQCITIPATGYQHTKRYIINTAPYKSYNKLLNHRNMSCEDRTAATTQLTQQANQTVHSVGCESLKPGMTILGKAVQ
jgi:hypothetical protein